MRTSKIVKNLVKQLGIRGAIIKPLSLEQQNYMRCSCCGTCPTVGFYSELTGNLYFVASSYYSSIDEAYSDIRDRILIAALKLDDDEVPDIFPNED